MNHDFMRYEVFLMNLFNHCHPNTQDADQVLGEGLNKCSVSQDCSATSQ